MIEALIIKLLFAPISIYDLKLSSTPRPFALLELSIIILGCCFIVGWYITGKRVDRLYKQIYDTDRTCHNVSLKKRSDWMLVVDNKVRFLFKSLYWYCVAYLHSLFVFLVILVLMYSFILYVKCKPLEHIFSNFFDVSRVYTYVTEKHVIWEGEDIINKATETKCEIPGMIGMSGIFVFLKKDFLLLHAIVFITGFIFFYINCLIFLQAETGNDVPAQVVTVNRERFKFLLYISYIFIDSCYMIFEIVMLLYFECPSDLEDKLKEKKKERLKDNLVTIINKIRSVEEVNHTKYKDFVIWFKTLKDNFFDSSEKRTILKKIASLPKNEKDSFIKQIFEKND